MNVIHTSETKAPIPYPNAASKRYFLNKVADLILSAAICIGVVAILFFLVTMF